MTAQTHSEAERQLIETAKRVLPGGTFGNVAGDIVIREGRGGRVWDESGNEYVDFLLGSGPMLVGHSRPEVVAAVAEQVPHGTTFFANNRQGILLAEAIVAAVPCAEQIRFVSSGTEADAYAMRLARAFKKREKILKFEGGYHGMSDYSLISLAPKRPGNFPQGVADGPGIPRSVQSEVLVAPFNDLATVTSLVREHRHELAAIIVEPFQRLIPPQPGFLEGLRKVTRENDVLLVFDEVVTGFRFAYGGAQEYYGVVPDICTLGKVIGGGFPLAAIAASKEIMALFDKATVGEEAFLLQIGTLSGNPVAAAAGLASLKILREPGAYKRLFATGEALMAGFAELVKRSGLEAQVIGVPPLFDIVFTDAPVRNYRDTVPKDPELPRRFNRLLRERGILKGDTKYYVSLAHTEDDVAHAKDAWSSALNALAEGRGA